MPPPRLQPLRPCGPVSLPAQRLGGLAPAGPPQALCGGHTGQKGMESSGPHRSPDTGSVPLCSDEVPEPLAEPVCTGCCQGHCPGLALRRSARHVFFPGFSPHLTGSAGPLLPIRDSGEFCGVTGSGARLCRPHSPVFLGLLTTQLPTTGSQIPKNCCWILSCQLNSYRTKPQPPYYDFRGPQRRGQSRCPRRQRLCLGAQARGRPLHPHLNHTGWARAAPFLSPALGDLGPD